jgi:hypothetical protein
MECLFHGRLTGRVGFEFETGNLTIRNAARNDPLKVSQVRHYVEREAVRGYSLRNVDTDCGDFFLGNASPRERPDTGKFADPLCHHAKVTAGTDERLFEEANIVNWAEVWAFFSREVAPEIDDGVSDELTWAGVGDVASAVDLMQFNSALRQHFITDQNIRAMRIAAECKYRRMFQQKQGVADKVLLPGSNYLLLDGHGLCVWDSTEMKEIDVHQELVVIQWRKEQPSMNPAALLANFKY